MLNFIRSGLYIEALLFVIVAVLSIIMHELAHGYMAIKNGDLTPKMANRMNFNPVNHFDLLGFGLFMFVGFGWAKPVPVNPNNFHNYRRGLFQVSVAGVFLNFVVAFFSYAIAVLLLEYYYNADISIYFFRFFSFLYSINLALCVFNLLPIYPLDGFRILESRLRRNNPYIDFMYRYGLYVFIGFILLLNFTDFNFFGKLVEIIGIPIRAFWGLFGL